VGNPIVVSEDFVGTPPVVSEEFVGRPLNTPDEIMQSVMMALPNFVEIYPN